MLQQLVEQLQADNAKLPVENSKLSKERNNMRVQCSYWKRKSSDLTEKVFEQSRMITDSEYIANSKRQRKDAQWRRLSICGGYRLASKRNIGHTSCTALAEVLDVQISRQCIVSWELGLADNLIFPTRQWHQHMQSRLHDRHKQGSLTWAVTTVRADATNSSTLQSYKVHSCEITTLVHLGIAPDHVDAAAFDDAPDSESQPGAFQYKTSTA